MAGRAPLGLVARDRAADGPAANQNVSGIIRSKMSRTSSVEHPIGSDLYLTTRIASRSTSPRKRGEVAARLPSALSPFAQSIIHLIDEMAGAGQPGREACGPAGEPRQAAGGELEHDPAAGL